jgi:hypothetical protein
MDSAAKLKESYGNREPKDLLISRNMANEKSICLDIV